VSTSMPATTIILLTPISEKTFTRTKNIYPKSLTLHPKPHPSFQNSCAFQVWQGCLWRIIDRIGKGQYRSDDQKVNQWFNTNYNKWHFNRLMKHLQKSIMQLYLQKVTL
jgi:hypothetical protein